MQDKESPVVPAQRRKAQVEERMRTARDTLPGRRNDLPQGALRGLPPEPQGDENRDPPANAPTPPP
jgi:hypothetical protein